LLSKPAVAQTSPFRPLNHKGVFYVFEVFVCLKIPPGCSIVHHYKCAETGEKGGEFEWDEFDATTTVNDGH